MEVRCERCDTEYEFDDSLVTERGVPVKCTQCGHLFKVFPDSGLRSASRGEQPTQVLAPPTGADLAPRAASAPQATGPAYAPTPSNPPLSALAQPPWYLRQAGGTIYTLQDLGELRRWILEGRVAGWDELGRAGEPWRTLSSLPEFALLFQGPASLPAQGAVPAALPAARSEVAQPSTPPFPWGGNDAPRSNTLRMGSSVASQPAAEPVAPGPPSSGTWSGPQILPPGAAPPSGEWQMLAGGGGFAPGAADPRFAQAGAQPSAAAALRRATPPAFRDGFGEFDDVDEEYLEVMGLGRRRRWLRNLGMTLLVLLLIAGAAWLLARSHGPEIAALVSGIWSGGAPATASSPLPAAPSEPPSLPSADRAPDAASAPATPDLGPAAAPAAPPAATAAPTAPSSSPAPQLAPSPPVPAPESAPPRAGQLATVQAPAPAAPAPAATAAPAPAAPAAARPDGAPAEATRPGPSGYEGLLRAAREHLLRDRSSKALALYERALSARPSSAEALTGIGWCHMNLGRPHIALLKFEKARQVNPRFGDALIGVGKAQRSLGRTEEAKAAYRLYLQEHPTGSKASIAKAALERIE